MSSGAHRYGFAWRRMPIPSWCWQHRSIACRRGDAPVDANQRHCGGLGRFEECVQRVQQVDDDFGDSMHAHLCRVSAGSASVEFRQQFRAGDWNHHRGVRDGLRLVHDPSFFRGRSQMALASGNHRWLGDLPTRGAVGPRHHRLVFLTLQPASD